ncbi:LysR family transcriptional regulator, partial [Pseudomonas stutzeri]|nr:LysR family transcriptional regulator [Stutzerimonas stutzeri]
IQIPRALFEGVADVGICSENALEAFPGLQTVPYRSEELALVVPLSHPLACRPELPFCDTLEFDYVGLHEHSSISLAMQDAARAANAELRLRIQVTTLDAMARMIINGLGIGIMPRRAYQLLGARDLASITLTDPWARRQLSLASKDFELLSSTAKLLVSHLQQTTQ